SSSFTTRATSTTRSPGVRFMTFTPCVLRPEIRIPSTGTRIMIPLLVIIMSSSSGSTSLSATMSPVLSDRLSVMIPRPPRCCTRYSSSSERLPIPFSVTVSSVDLRRTTTMSMTWSFLSSAMPLTPVAVRDMGRTATGVKGIVVFLVERDALDAGRRAAHVAHVFLVEADAHAVPGRQHDVVLAVRDLHVDQLVALLDVDGANADRARVPKLRQHRLLDHAVLRGEQQE